MLRNSKIKGSFHNLEIYFLVCIAKGAARSKIFCGFKYHEVVVKSSFVGTFSKNALHLS